MTWCACALACSFALPDERSEVLQASEELLPKNLGYWLHAYTPDGPLSVILPHKEVRLKGHSDE